MASYFLFIYDLPLILIRNPYYDKRQALSIGTALDIRVYHISFPIQMRFMLSNMRSQNVAKRVNVPMIEFILIELCPCGVYLNDIYTIYTIIAVYGIAMV